MQITGASMAIRAHWLAGSSLGSGGRVNGGQVPRVALSREEAQPVRRPSRSGELANSATSAGPRAWAARHRVAAWSASPASRQTCIDAVLHIIREPCGPMRSKAACMASYRGTCNNRFGGRCGSVPWRPSTSPQPSSRSARVAASAVATEMSSAADLVGGVEISTWPPGSTVIRDPAGSGAGHGGD